MATKTISLTEEAYELMASRKEPTESFSDVVTKEFRKYSVGDLVGILSSKHARELRASVKELRERMRKSIDQTAKRLQ